MRENEEGARGRRREILDNDGERGGRKKEIELKEREK